MSVSFKLESFEGPLDLLLQLVEKQELDISTLSLATVADQFLVYMKDQPELPLEDVADFLLVATKLIYLKSKLLVPHLETSSLEEGPSLEEQLRRYRAFVEVSKTLATMWKAGAQSFPRMQRPMRMREVRYIAPKDVTVQTLHHAMQLVIAKLEPLIHAPRAAIERVVSIQDMLGILLRHVQNIARTSFRSFVGTYAERANTIVGFLALLELVKQRFVFVEQTALFQDITIESNPDAPAQHPLVQSYV